MTVIKTALVAAFLAGAAALPGGALAADAVQDNQVAPPPPPGKGEVVFFRRGTFVGAAISCAVHENGTKLTSLPPGHYAVVVADPGTHAYTVQSEAKDTLNVDVEAGEIQYASCHVKMGIIAGRPVLNPATEAEFKGHKYKLVESKAPAEPATPASAPAAPATPAPTQ